ncbi:aspartate/glutamate racemase family protein [Sulfitobacter sp.]|jgi:maleate isomerase|uniref:maleate cis-trans isomerase family protein n=1 Tax=Sulfitobacter sp. TaxID=1903071 RepID=UPI0039E409D8
MSYPYQSVPTLPPALGLIVLQADETLEGDMRAMMPLETAFYVSRVPSGDAVTTDTLAEMAAHLGNAAGLLPHAARFASIGYGCTSGAAEIGPERVAGLIRAGADSPHVTNPLSALIAACRHLGVTRLGLLSPYVAQVSAKLRDALGRDGIETPVFGSFDEAEEAKVVRIDAASIVAAAVDLASQGGAEAVFLSCTNLRTLTVIDRIERETGLPCLSSNQVLAWHMAQAAGITARIPGRLGQSEAPLP